MSDNQPAERLLIVEDNEHDRFLYKRLLKKGKHDSATTGHNETPDTYADCEIHEAATKEEAIALFKEIQPDCVLLDYLLPDTNGLDLLRTFKELADHPCVIMVTGQGDEMIAVEAIKIGATDYLIKDKVTQENLQKTLKGATEKARLHRELAEKNQQIRSANQQLRQALEELKKKETSLQSQTDKLTHINQDLDNFVYMASHDLKSPVNTLTSLLDIFEEDVAGHLPNQGIKTLQMIKKSVHKLNRIITDLTQAGKIQQDARLEKERVNIEEVLQDVREDLDEAIRQQRAEFELCLDTRVFLLARKNLRSILYNLISNAIKYRHPERTPLVSIRTFQEKGFTALAVSDNGMGLSEDQQESLFTAFKRFHDHVKGSGIGLYMIKKIVENNGGRIVVESELNKGSRFSIFFPGQA